MLLTSACEAIELAANGVQRTTLNSRSLIIGHYIAGGLLEYKPTVKELIAAGMQMFNYDKKKKWTFKQVTRTVIRAVRDGMKEPMDGEEGFRAVAEANRLFCENPQCHEDMINLIIATGAQLDAGDREGDYVPDELARSEEPPRENDAEPEEEAEVNADEPPRSERFLNAGDDHELPPPRGWLLGNIFARKFISTLLGDGGVGKTSLRYAQYMSMAIGRSLTGDHVFVRCRVLIVSLEDDMDELRRRIWALRIHYGVTAKELKNWMYLWTPGTKGGKLMEMDKRGNPAEGELRGRLETLIKKLKLDFIGIDPFIKTHCVEENDNTAIDMVTQVLTGLCHQYNVAVDVPHHVSKPRAGVMMPRETPTAAAAPAP
jgi:hypothetical protein